MPANKNLAPTTETHEAAPPVQFEASWSPYTDARHDSPDSGELVVWIKDAPDLDLLANAISGHVSAQTNDRGTKMAVIDGAHLEEEYRHKGIGSRMYRAFTRLAMEHGATQLGGISPSEDALKARLRVFGPDRMTFYDKGVNDSDAVISTRTEITAEECQRRVDAATRRKELIDEMVQKYELEDPTEITDYLTEAERAQIDKYKGGVTGYYVVIDLEGLDTSDWEAGLMARKT